MDFTLLDIEKLLEAKLDQKLEPLKNTMKCISNFLYTVNLRLDGF